MNFTEHDDSRHDDLRITATVSNQELSAMGAHANDFITRRIVDAVYAELLPVVRDAILKSLDSHKLAQIVEGELALAIKELY